MRRMLWVALCLVGCGGDDGDLLASLAGYWSGNATTDAGTFPVTAEFAWDDGAELLTGQVVVEEAPAEVHAYAVRRSQVVDDETYLELTDVNDGTRGLDVSGRVEASAFAGGVTLRYPCGPDTCGYVGDLALLPADAPPVDTDPTAGDTDPP